VPERGFVVGGTEGPALELGIAGSSVDQRVLSGASQCQARGGASR
jgi:hypothetical protein